MAKKISVEIVGDASSLQRAFGSAGKASHGFGSVLSSALKVGGLAAAAGVGVAAVAVKKFADAAMDAQRVQAQTQSQLKALGISYADHAGQIDKAITATSQLSGIDDEELQGSFNNLVRVTGNVSTALRDTTLAADIARGKHIELGAAASIVQKAQLGMVTMLKRMGIEIKPVTAAVDALKESKKKYTKAEMDAAKAADLTATKQKGIAELQKKFAGAAKAYGDTAQGAQDRFRVAVENLEEALGAGLLPMFTKVLSGAAKFTEGLITELGKAHGFKAKLEVVWTGVQGAAQRLADAISGALQQVNWSATGAAIVDGVQQGLSKAKEIGQKLADIVSQTMNQVPWEKVGTAVGPAIAAGLVSGLVVLMSPGFWTRHWVEMASIALAVIPITRLGGIALKIVGALVRPLETLLGPMLGRAISAATTGVLQIAERLGPRLGGIFLDAVSLAGRTFARLPGVIGSAIGNLGGFVAGKLGSFKTLVIKALAFDAILHAAIAGTKEIADAIVDLLGDAVSGMFSIGQQIVHGIMGGLSSLEGALIAKAKEIALAPYNAMKSVLGISSPSRVTKEGVGIPMAQGVIEGWIVGSATLPDKVSKTMRATVEAARNAIAAGRSSFSSAWAQLTQDALTAFDAATARLMGRLEARRGELTASEKKLQALQNAHDEADRQQAISDAQKALDAAKAGGDQDAIVAAQRQLDDALYNEQIASLQRQADKERAAKDARFADKEKELQARRDLERRHFEEHLIELEAQLEREGASHRRAQNKIIALFNAYGVSYHQAGLDLGKAFAAGIRESANEVESAAATLAQIVARYLPHSPAEKGALSTLPNWDNYLLPGLHEAVAKVEATMVGVKAPQMASAAFSGATLAGANTGGSSSSGIRGVSTGDTYHFSFPNYVGDKRDLVDTVRTEFARINKTNGGVPGKVF